MASKREKRLARQEIQRNEFEKKKARQAEALDVAKTIAIMEGAHPEKVVQEAPPPIGKRPLEWSRDEADTDGHWSWGPRSCLNEDWDALLHPFLLEYSKKTWFQIGAEKTKGRGGARVQKHIDYSVNSICKEARDRLIELEKDDVDRIFRFRLSGKKRFYGINREHVFMVLWWDPEHNIYPTANN